MHLRETDAKHTLAFVPGTVLAVVPELVLVVQLVLHMESAPCRTLLESLEQLAPSVCTGTVCLRPAEEAGSKLEADPVLEQTDAHKAVLAASRVRENRHA